MIDVVFFDEYFWYLLGMLNLKKILIFVDLIEFMGFYILKDFLLKVFVASKVGWLFIFLLLFVLFYGEK